MTDKAAPSLSARSLGLIVALIAIALCTFQLYTAGIKSLNLFYQRSIHLSAILILAFCFFQLRGETRAEHC
ncbi:MAG: hypothetical protein R2865_11915 [Deinococcales bacterium]